MNEYIEPKSSLDVIKQFATTIWGEENLWDNARFILADVPLDVQETKRILPFGMRLIDPPTATLFIVDYKKTSFTEPYKEAALLVHVRTPLGRGVHCPWMVVDDDTAMIYGRELLGYPKKMAEFEFEESEDRVYASVTRRGVKVLEMEGRRGASQDEPLPIFGRKTFNAGGMGQFFLLSPIWLFRPTEIIHESYSSDVKLTLRESENDPIAKFVSGEPVSGRIAVTDIPSAKYIFPVSAAGLMFFGINFFMRFK